MLAMLFAGVSCAAHVIDKGKGKDIAYNKLREMASSNYFSDLHVNVSALPAPVVEFQGNILVVDYKDIRQNAWIVVIVHPDGAAEVSYTKIRD